MKVSGKKFWKWKKKAPQYRHHPLPQIKWSLHIGRGERSRLNSPMCTLSPLQRGTILPKWGCCKDMKPIFKHHPFVKVFVVIKMFFRKRLTCKLQSVGRKLGQKKLLDTRFQKPGNCGNRYKSFSSQIQLHKWKHLSPLAKIQIQIPQSTCPTQRAGCQQDSLSRRPKTLQEHLRRQSTLHNWYPQRSELKM